MAREGQKRLCFIVGPIGDSDSETRIHADWLLEEIIQPAMLNFPEFDVVRADKIAQPGMIDAQIIGHLLDADLVIADLSNGNANAFYEIGIRHMVQKPIIHMQLSDEKIPFDVSLYRATKFSRLRPIDIRRARDDLVAAVRAVLASDYKVDNPVTRARGQLKLEQSATPEQKVVMEQLKTMQERLDQLEGLSAKGDPVPTFTPTRVVGTGRSGMVTFGSGRVVLSQPREDFYVRFKRGHKITDDDRARVADVLDGVIDLEDVRFLDHEIVVSARESFLETSAGKLVKKMLLRIPSLQEVTTVPF